MNKKDFLKFDENLKSNINDGLKLDENGVFGPIMHQISFRACLILGMRSIAYRKRISEPYRSERDDYFINIESILGTIYSDFSKLTFEDKIKMCGNNSFSPQTSKERFEAMKKIKQFLPKLKTSWVEKAWMKN